MFSYKNLGRLRQDEIRIIEYSDRRLERVQIAKVETEA